MKKLLISFMLILFSLFAATSVFAEADLDVNTPAINAIKASMQGRHSQLAPHYNSGAIGLTKDGFIEIHDTKAVPLKDRGGINRDRKSVV